MEPTSVDASRPVDRPALKFDSTRERGCDAVIGESTWGAELR
ncbi:hypothetical protein [Natronococcus wangiae]|nr:hypothetical protein [Natronococcus sp. AD5]